MTTAVLADLVRAVAVDVLAGRGLDVAAVPEEVTVERPRDPSRGDYATSLALRSASRAGVAPAELAGWLAAGLEGTDAVATAEVAGPGFVNLRLSPGARAAVVREALAHEAPGDRATDFRADAARYPPRRGIDEHVLGRRVDANPVFAVQHAHARLAALARGAAALGVPVDEPDLELLAHPRETDLIAALADDGRESGPRHLEELAGAAHRFVDTCRVLPQGDEEPTARHTARLALCAAARTTIASGLHLLGVGAPDRI